MKNEPIYIKFQKKQIDINIYDKGINQNQARWNVIKPISSSDDKWSNQHQDIWTKY